MNRFELMNLVMNILNICEECEKRKPGCKVPCDPVLKLMMDADIND